MRESQSDRRAGAEAPSSTGPAAGHAERREGSWGRLLDRLERLRRRANRRYRLYGLAAFVGVCLLVCTFLGLLDWLVHPTPSGARWGLSLIAAVTILATGYRWLWVPWRHPITTEQAAARIEHLVPVLRDRLSSLVSFAGSEDRKLQDQRLFQVATAEVAAAFDLVSPRDLFNARPLLRAGAAAVVGVGILIGLAVALPTYTRIGATRLVRPWASVGWPRMNHLRLTGPEAIEAGEPVMLRVRDRDGQPLPRDVRLLYRAEQAARGRSVPVDPAGGMVTIPGDQTQASLLVRAVGGDDQSMPWRKIESRQPPQIESFRFRVTPPSSTGLASRVETRPQFVVPSGSEIEALVSINDAEVALRLMREDLALPTSVADSAGSWRSTWTIEAEPAVADYAWHYTDAVGLKGMLEPNFRITAAADRPPVVRWEDPPPTQLTRSAVLALQAVAEDEYGVERLGWVKPGEREADAAPDSSAPALRGVQTATPAAERLEAKFTVELAQVQGVEDAETVRVVAVAVDTAGQRGTSRPLTFALVEEEQLLRQWAEETERITESLREAAKTQRIASERTREAAASDDAERAETAAQIAEAAQRQTLERLSDGAGSVQQRAQRLLQSAAINRVDADFLESLANATESLEGTIDQQLKPSAESIAEALAASSEDARRTALEAATQRQAAGEEALRDSLTELDRSLQTRLAQQALQEAAETQQRLAAATERAMQQAGDELRGDLANQQRELARRMDQMQRELDQLAGEAGEHAERQQAAQDAAERLAEAELAGPMRDAADALEQRGPEAALPQQQQIAQQLQAMAEQLSGSEARGGSEELVDRATRTWQEQRAARRAIEEVQAREGVGGVAAAEQQRRAIEESETLRQAVESMPLFPDSVQQAGERMEASLARLKRDPRDKQALAEARAAEARLREVAEAIRQAEQDRDAATPGGGEAPQPNEGEAEDAANPPALPMASLLLVRAQQDRLKRETERLRQQNTSPAGAGADEAAEELQRVRREQQQLVQQVQAALERAAEQWQASPEAGSDGAEATNEDEAGKDEEARDAASGKPSSASVPVDREVKLAALKAPRFRTFLERA